MSKKTFVHRRTFSNMKGEKRSTTIYAYELTDEESNEYQKTLHNRDSLIISDDLIFTKNVLAYGSMADLLANWMDYRTYFINLFGIADKDIPWSDMGTVNTKCKKSEVYPDITERHNFIMRTEKPFPLNILYKAIEAVSPDRYMNWKHIILIKEEEEIGRNIV